MDEISGGTAEENVALFEAMWGADGGTGPRTDIVVVNAGAALVVAGLVADLAEGVESARAALRDGRVADLVARMRSWAA